MEDRVNLIAQLTETKIEAQETLQRTIDEYEAKANGGADAQRCEVTVTLAITLAITVTVTVTVTLAWQMSQWQQELGAAWKDKPST